VLVGQSNVVALASPVDAGEPSSLCVHAGFPIVTRATATLAGPCTGACSAVSSRGLCRGRFAGARVPPRCSKHSGRWVAPGESARSPNHMPASCRHAGGRASFRFASLSAPTGVDQSGDRIGGVQVGGALRKTDATSSCAVLATSTGRRVRSAKPWGGGRGMAAERRQEPPRRCWRGGEKPCAYSRGFQIRA
jgi:hypothetical protein